MPAARGGRLPAGNQVEQQRTRLRIHVEPNGLRWGTPRTGEEDLRFAKDEVPADAFGPNAATGVAVLARLSWFTYDDAKTLDPLATAGHRRPRRKGTRLAADTAGDR